MALFWILVSIGLQPVAAGWNQGKGDYAKDNDWRGYGNSSSYGRYGGKGGGMNGQLLNAMADMLGGRRSSSRHERTRSRRSPSRSRSPSSGRERARSSRSRGQQQELEELRKYRAEQEAAKAAEQEAARRKEEKESRDRELREMEERILKALPTPQSAAAPRPGATRSAASGEGDASMPEISPLAARLIEVLFDKTISGQGLTEWAEVEQRLSALEASAIRDLFAAKFPDSSMPRLKAQRISKLMELAMEECKV